MVGLAILSLCYNFSNFALPYSSVPECSGAEPPSESAEEVNGDKKKYPDLPACFADFFKKEYPFLHAVLMRFQATPLCSSVKSGIAEPDRLGFVWCYAKFVGMAPNITWNDNAELDDEANFRLDSQLYREKDFAEYVLYTSMWESGQAFYQVDEEKQHQL